MAYRDERDTLETKLEALLAERRQLDPSIARTHAALQAMARSERSLQALSLLAALGIAALFMLGLGAAWIFLSLGCNGHPRIDWIRTDARTVAGAAEMYVTKHASRCPTLYDLTHEGFLNASARVEDAWGTPFRIACEGEEVVVSSAGPDGQHDTGDDVR